MTKLENPCNELCNQKTPKPFEVMRKLYTLNLCIELCNEKTLNLKNPCKWVLPWENPKPLQWMRFEMRKALENPCNWWALQGASLKINFFLTMSARRSLLARLVSIDRSWSSWNFFTHLHSLLISPSKSGHPCTCNHTKNYSTHWSSSSNNSNFFFFFFTSICILQ